MKNAIVETVLRGSLIGAGLSVFTHCLFRRDIRDCNTTSTFQSIQLIRSDFLRKIPIKMENPNYVTPTKSLVSAIVTTLPTTNWKLTARNCSAMQENPIELINTLKPLKC